MDKPDIIYLLKDTISNPELRFSLRSVQQNFSGHRVVFVGGKPIGLNPDIRIKTEQVAGQKWKNAQRNLIEACSDDRLSEDVYLFNDDFFILEEMGEIPVFTNGNIKEFMEMVLRGSKGSNEFVEKTLSPLYDLLVKEGLPTKNYAVHVPMKINRKKMLEVLAKYPYILSSRSLYGNYYKMPSIEIDPSGKMQDGQQQNRKRGVLKGRKLISTTDESFAGVIGRELRKMFTRPSRWEVV